MITLTVILTILSYFEPLLNGLFLMIAWEAVAPQHEDWLEKRTAAERGKKQFFSFSPLDKRGEAAYNINS